MYIFILIPAVESGPPQSTFKLPLHNNTEMRGRRFIDIYIYKKNYNHKHKRCVESKGLFTQMQIVSEIFIHILFTFLFCFFFINQILIGPLYFSHQLPTV